MKNDFSTIKDYARLRSCLNAVSEEIAYRGRKITSWKARLLPVVRLLRKCLDG